jgi:hypothetical protein
LRSTLLASQLLKLTAQCFNFWHPIEILRESETRQGNALVTKLQADKAEALHHAFPNAFFDEASGIFALDMHLPSAPEPEVGIICAGISDLFVVNEAFYTLAYLGVTAERIFDVGIAGVHRLLGRLDVLRRFRVGDHYRSASKTCLMPAMRRIRRHRFRLKMSCPVGRVAGVMINADLSGSKLDIRIKVPCS